MTEIIIEPEVTTVQVFPSPTPPPMIVSPSPDPAVSVTDLGDEQLRSEFTSMLDAHVQSEQPHPVYDDPPGPSLTLLYENAKV